jgi:hypothetical protein
MKWVDCERINDTQWIDLHTSEVFNPLETYNSNLQSCFLCEPNEFQPHTKYGVSKFSGLNVDHQDSECIISGFEKLKKFKDSKILIIGAGPSLVQCKDAWYSKIKEYDYIWSCNHYYQCKELDDVKIDFCTLGNQVDYSSTSLINRLEKDKTVFAIDMNVSMNCVSFSKFFKTQKNERLFFSTRFFGKIGCIPRMMVLAILSGVKHISLVGVDGATPAGKTSNGDSTLKSSTVFRDEKDFPKVEDGRNGPQQYSIVRRHYVTFWNYVLNSLDHNKNISFLNYGKDYEHNLTKEIPEVRE